MDTWWIDRCLGIHDVPNRLRVLGAKVVLYADTYPDKPAVADAEWIPYVSKEGWVILTKDTNIRKNSLERTILENAGARYVALASAKMTGPDQADVLEKHWKTIVGVVGQRKPPIILNVTRSDVSEWRSKASVWKSVPHKR